MNFCANHNIWFNGYCPHCYPSGLYSSNPAITGLGTGISPESPKEDGEEQDKFWEDIRQEMEFSVDRFETVKALRKEYHITKKSNTND